MYLYTFTGELQIGNPNLKPETSDNYEIGFKYEGDLVTSDFAVFYSDADDYIETVEIDIFPNLPFHFRQFTYNNIASAKPASDYWRRFFCADFSKRRRLRTENNITVIYNNIYIMIIRVH